MGLVPRSKSSMPHQEHASTVTPRVAISMQHRVLLMDRFTQAVLITMFTPLVSLRQLLLLPTLTVPAAGPVRISATSLPPERKLFLAIPGLSTQGEQMLEEPLISFA